jgi:serine/threonine protein kinase
MSDSTERWRSLEELYQAALEREPSARAVFLNEACPDAELRREVASLLDARSAGDDLLERPAIRYAAQPLQPGAQLGQYRVGQRIGAGGMGEVYCATDTRLRRAVALKVLPAVYASDPQWLARFQREARVLASLNHPHIAAIYGLEESAPPALAMELVEGPTLAERLARGKMPLEQVLAVAKQIAEALEYAHEKGVIHRDLKPANIKISSDGAVKVLDFGLAKGAQTSLEDSPTVTATKEGVIKGTPAYMSPEQAKGLPLDKRADIWAFGVVLFEMLAGRLVFAHGTPAEVLAAVVREELPWEGLPADTPAAIRRLLKRCLEKDPKLRLRDIGEARIAIEEAQSGVEQPAPLIAAPHNSRWIAATAALAILLLATLAVWAWFRARPAPPRALVRFTVDPPPGERFYWAFWPLVSPDGERILFGVAPPQPNGPARVWMYRVSTGESAPFQNVLWSPVSWYEHKIAPWALDSSSIAVFEGEAVSRVDITGGHSEVLRESVSEFAWGPSGSYFFGIPDKGLFWVERGLPRRQVTVQKPSEGIHEWPQLLPDGKSFLFEKRTTSKVETWLARLDGKEPKLLLIKASQAWYAPPGYLLYWDSGSIFAQRFDAGRGTLIGDARTLVNGVAAFASAPFGMFSVSDNGVLAYRQGPVSNPSRLTWFDRSGNVIGSLGEVADYTNPALSPDEKRLAVCIRDSNGKRNIWVFDLARGTKTRLNFEPADEANPTWSPDGSGIAYSSDRHGHRDIYVKSFSGSGQERVLLESGDDKSVLDWSTDGKLLFYNVLRPAPGHYRELWILPLTGSQRLPAPFSGAPYIQDQAAVAPDSRSVVYRSQENGAAMDLYLQPLPSNGQRWQITTSGGDGPQWRGDGREIFYCLTSTASNAIMAADVSAQGSPEPPHQLFPLRLTLTGRNRFVVTRDGQRFLAITPEEARDPATMPFVVILNWQRLLEDR